LRRQVPPAGINAGSLAKQKSPVRQEVSTSKDTAVSSYFHLLLFYIADLTTASFGA
jgi:hypothetical protein